MENNLLIYTDGSSAPNPRRGGSGFRIIFPDDTSKDFSSYSYQGATNNEMELQACVLALKEVVKLNSLKGSQGILVLTDSQYIVNNYKNAMFNWPRQKWIRSNGEPVLNTQIWKEIIRLMKRIGYKFHIQVDFEKVEAHSGIKNNEDVDKLAKLSREGTEAKVRLSVSRVRRSKTKSKTIRGSIKGEGQKIRLRVITAKLIRPQNLYQLRCEVLSKKSKYFGMTDLVISKFFMTAGHTYDVVLMKNLDHCRVEKVIREV